MDNNGYHLPYQLEIIHSLMYVCICKQITDSQIHQEVENGVTTLEELSEKLGVSTQCGRCKTCAMNTIKSKVSDMAYFPVDVVAV